MSGNSTFGKSVLSALAVALVTTAIPATAFAQDERREERAARPWSGGEVRRDTSQRDDMQRGGSEFRGRRNAEVQTPIPQAQPAPQQRPAWSGTARPERAENPGWRGRGNGENAQRWGEQNRGTVERRDPQERATTRQPGWNGTRWNPTNRSQERAGVDGRNWDRNRDRNWNNNRDQNPAWNGRNPTYSDRDRNRDYRRDDNRNGWSNRDGWSNRNGWNGRNGWNSRDNDRRWSNNWRQDRRYDWSGFRNSNRNHFRMPRYYAPFRGYNYSRLSVGIFLNSGFYGSNYWINDPWSYRLPPAYAGYRWVRYYNDVILVDTFTGEVADVIPNFFW